MQSIYQAFLIKYSEIGLKGKNRYKFEDTLVSRIRNSLDIYKENFKVYKEQERIYVDSRKGFSFNTNEVIEKINKVFGVFSISPIKKIDFITDINELSSIIIDYVKNVYGDAPSFTFKVRTKRLNKVFPMHSDEINARLGNDILENFKNLKVDVHKPEVTIYIEIRNHINIYSEKFAGPGGLPIGTSGKAFLLLSGGIDSPVAGYMIAKRGVEIECIYFSAPPYTSDRATEKVKTLAKILSTYTYKIKLHVINFTKIQLLIYDKCPHDELTIIMRRYMMRISEMIAKADGGLALITGESVGQVASQTCESLLCTNAVTTIPVFRPLIGFDKDEIVEKANKIGTFETSILPYEDCCTIFVAKHPVTKPKIDKIIKSEKLLENEIDALVDEAINTREIFTIKNN